MSRLQLALNVSNLNEAIEFYSKYFNTTPAKVREGYANFAIDEPPLKLVLFENAAAPGSINHMGVEFFDQESVVAEVGRLQEVGVLPTEVAETTCCYAVQDKAWVDAPDGLKWESYVVLADADGLTGVCCA